MKFFSKKSSNKHAKFIDDSDDDDSSAAVAAAPRSEPSSPSARSPTKSSSKASQKGGGAANSPQAREVKSRSSLTFVRQNTAPSSPTSSSRRKKRADLDLHPLNLPPEQRKRLSNLSAMSGRDSMDIDRESPISIPSSPSSGAAQPAQASSSPPQQQPPTNGYTVPVSQEPNGQANEDEAPVPPPHSSKPASPVPSAAEQAEVFKANGNQAFQAKDYKRAIDQYSNGMSRPHFVRACSKLG
jgi:DnaJ family protein C protein 7